ncbi:MAG TPA: threonylcarbamoyl-AMP synthase [Treponema sp.]|nr:threonylcarbamoyl-AMP synthase [Treponema sp.]
MEFLSITDASIAKAAGIIAAGGLAAFPTETVYGLGADAFNTAALAKVFAAKNRPRFDPLIIHIAAVENLGKIADLNCLSSTARERLETLAANLWPGPLTLILPKRSEVPDLATSGLQSAAVRIPAHSAARKLIALAGGAVAAPSANPFGALSPTRAEHVRDLLGEKVDIILDGGSTEVGVESTVLDITGERPRILRPGGVSRETIEALIGKVETAAENAAGQTPDTEAAGMVSPGRLKSHYAPRARLAVFAREDTAALPSSADGSAFLFFDGETRDKWLDGRRGAFSSAPVSPPVVKTLSEKADVIEAAANLFQILHEIDKPGIAQIYAQLAPGHGLGAAINDRLQRAAAR